MKFILFLLCFLCIFVVTGAIQCHVNEFGENENLSEQSDCKACSYHFEICEVEGKEVTKVGRLCLNETLIKYENDEGSQNLDKPGECIFFTKNGCENSMYICEEEKCNDFHRCGNSPLPSLSPPSDTSSFSASTNPSTRSPSSSATTFTESTSTAPTTTIAEENNGSLTVNLFSVFGLLTISFFILY